MDDLLQEQFRKVFRRGFREGVHTGMKMVIQGLEADLQASRALNSAPMSEFECQQVDEIVVGVLAEISEVCHD